MLKSGRRAWLITIPALLLLFGLLLRVTSGSEMHPDETLVYHFTRFDIPYTVFFLATQDVHPPLWFSFFWVWRHLVGDSEFAGRMQALLFSLLTLAMTYRVGRDWFGTLRAGVFSMLILGVSAFFTAYALEIRPYALVMLLATVSMWLFSRWMQRETWWLAIAYGALTGITFYIHYFSAFLVMAQTLYFLLRRRSRRLMMQDFAAGVVALVVWLPWIPAFLVQVEHLRVLALEAGNSYGLGVGTPATTQATSLETVIKLAQLATNGQVLLYGLVLVFSIVMLYGKRHYRLALLWAFGIPTIALVLNSFAAVYTQRYVAYLLIGLALALGAALAAIKLTWVRALAFGAFIAVNLGVMPSWLPVRVPYRELYHEVAALAQPGDLALNTPADRSDQFLEWEQALHLPPELQAGITTDVNVAADARRVWFMTGDWFNPAVRRQFDALEPTHPVQRVLGQCDNSWCYLVQLLEAPPLGAAQRFGGEMDFWGVDVDSATREAIATRLWWRVERAPTLDYSISLRLLDAVGGIITQADGPINHYGAEIVPTSQLQPGKIYIDWRTLDMPPGILSGTYSLELVVYQTWDSQRLRLADGSDALKLDEFTIS